MKGVREVCLFVPPLRGRPRFWSHRHYRVGLCTQFSTSLVPLPCFTSHPEGLLFKQRSCSQKELCETSFSYLVGKWPCFEKTTVDLHALGFSVALFVELLAWCGSPRAVGCQLLLTIATVLSS